MTPPQPTPTQNLNPISIVGHVLYDTASSITGLVGLTPLQLLVGVAGAFLVYLVVTFVRANFGDPGWSVDEDAPEGKDGRAR